ncbi:response regulator transcription factor [Cohaesibacter celericrescens]|uniref:Two-component system response regulator n=1 Tax=Cohaesibacter celericrescens TaxID=2067669 RepID=A0A2N5XWK8_9HYPH|nr:response regulator transcription factor [Cohaesibacter celericrescens]PLW75489.1 two-component system response regulator [Cohaesibacter celericrescens]PLW78896.1 two-component system response regulator [Cohaesibacter celericrescens]
MIVIIDNRGIVAEGYTSGFEREGVASIGIMPQEFDSWVTSISETDIGSVEAFLLGDCERRVNYPGLIRKRCKNTPVIALNDTSSLELTLNLFAAGVDDVVRKPVHVREILVRAAAIRRRTGELKDMLPEGNIRVFFDGRAPEIGGEILELPRRERRILEFLFKNQERRVSRAQIYNAVYGLLNEGVEETVVESHISKLRKKLKVRLGYDPIDSKRYLGYMFKSGLENA